LKGTSGHITESDDDEKHFILNMNQNNKNKKETHKDNVNRNPQNTCEKVSTKGAVPLWH
jgi:hypothetical protein